MNDIYEEWGLEPRRIEKRLEAPSSVRGYASELYRRASIHYEGYQEYLDESVEDVHVDTGKLENAMYELEVCERLITRAEIDVQTSDGANYPYLGETGDDE